MTPPSPARPRRPRPRAAVTRALARAAVLVPLSCTADGIRIVLTRRAHALRHHRGQVAFPGGRFDRHRDDSLLATALREAAEEIGLKADAVRVLGALPEIRTISSGFVISPFVGQVSARYRYRFDASEVVQLFTMPLATCVDPSRRSRHAWTYGGATVDVPAVRYRGQVVWGATLRILDLLVESPLLRELRR